MSDNLEQFVVDLDQFAAKLRADLVRVETAIAALRGKGPIAPSSIRFSEEATVGQVGQPHPEWEPGDGLSRKQEIEQEIEQAAAVDEASKNGDRQVEQPKRPQYALKEDARDALVGVERITREDLAEKLGCSTTWAWHQLGAAEAKGIVERIPKGSARERQAYRYIVPSGQPAARSRYQGAEGRTRSEPVPGTGSNYKVAGNKFTREVAKAARLAGGHAVFQVASGHVKITGPKGTTSISGTPSIESRDRVRKQLREIGLDVRL